MSIHDLYSKRKKRIEHGNQPEIYQYETLPIKFRRQVIHIWGTAIVPYEKFVKYTCWQSIHEILTRELGEFSFSLAGQLSIILNTNNNPFEECQEFLLNAETSTDNLLDLIELTFNRIDRDIRYLVNTDDRISLLNDNGYYLQYPDDAIEELNHRFREHAIGYQYSNGQIIRVDSGFIHSDVVVPALKLLSNQCFAGAEEEFLSAHKHYRQQDYKPAIADALKAFESTMKTICDKCQWDYKPTDCAKDLIKVIFQNHLLPDYLQTQLSSLRSILESGVPTVRNKTSGHGQGTHPTIVPEYLTSYVLHLTASNIVFLMEAYIANKNLKETD